MVVLLTTELGFEMLPTSVELLIAFATDGPIVVRGISVVVRIRKIRKLGEQEN